MRIRNDLPEECTTQTISHCVLYMTEHTWCSKVFTALKGVVLHVHTHQHVFQHTHMGELLAWLPTHTWLHNYVVFYMCIQCNESNSQCWLITFCVREHHSCFDHVYGADWNFTTRRQVNTETETGTTKFYGGEDRTSPAGSGAKKKLLLSWISRMSSFTTRSVLSGSICVIRS